MRQSKTPPGAVFRAYNDMINQPHLLIAGATGSGKSTVIHGLINTILYYPPTEKQLILIDSKRVELIEYSRLPHTIYRATEPRQIAAAVTGAVNELERRFKRMERARIKLYTGSDIYIIIDELADLITTQKKDVLTPLKRIAQLGRAAKIHLILATQRPTKDIVSGEIKVNIDARLALRCPTKQDSRNIINVGGAELLPRYGYGYYLTPETIKPELITLPLISELEKQHLISWWS